MSVISIDGSHGEGGGQILRTALSLSAVTGKPFAIENIRARRSKPGLMRQHLTAVKAAAAICGAKADGAEVGSTRLRFEPGSLKAGEYAFNIGSAGSTSLVLQTVLPPLALADGASRVTLQGGTHNTGAPPFEFLDRAFLPLIRRIGFNADVELRRFGFYPAGGGEVRVEIQAPSTLEPLVIDERGAALLEKAKRSCLICLFISLNASWRGPSSVWDGQSKISLRERRSEPTGQAMSCCCCLLSKTSPKSP